MARRVDDLDERDYRARIDIRHQLREARLAAGLTQREVAERMNLDAANLRRLEAQGVDQSYSATVMTWARALDRRLVMEPVNFPAPAALRRAGSVNAMMALIGGAGDEWAVAEVATRLAGIRAACGVTATQMAARIGITSTAVLYIEMAGANSQLVVLQRHARAIARCSWRARDGYLALRLEPDTEMEHPG
jgi:transcriptional regulator with XRE-family HTH domain